MLQHTCLLLYVEVKCVYIFFGILLDSLFRTICYILFTAEYVSTHLNRPLIHIFWLSFIMLLRIYGVSLKVSEMNMPFIAFSLPP